jgi:hypothetical protein
MRNIVDDQCTPKRFNPVFREPKSGNGYGVLVKIVIWVIGLLCGLIVGVEVTANRALEALR